MFHGSANPGARCFARGKFDSFFPAAPGRARGHLRRDADVFYAKFPGHSNNFYYLGIPRIESRGKKNEDREAEEALGPVVHRGKTAVESGGGRGLDSSCTVNNTPPERDRLAHPRHPATIYLLFVLHTFVSWPPLPAAVPRGCLPPRKLEEKDYRRKTLLLRGTLGSAKSLHVRLAKGS